MTEYHQTNVAQTSVVGIARFSVLRGASTQPIGQVIIQSLNRHNITVRGEHNYILANIQFLGHETQMQWLFNNSHRWLHRMSITAPSIRFQQ